MAAVLAAVVAFVGLARIAAAEVSEEPWAAGGLAGTFTHPGGPSRAPTVLIIAGSGPTDRDGNGPGLATDTYRQIAAGLAAAGIRSLRYDKRGIGGSRGLVGREDDVVFDHFVEDAVTLVAALAARDDVSCVILAGHSEGGLIAIRAAGRVPVAAIILLATPGRMFDAVLRSQLSAAPAPDELRAQAFRILDALARGERVVDVPPPLWALFRPSVQPFLASLLNLDPVVELARTSVPVLVVQGGRDLQITRDDFERLVKARSDVRTLLMPEANHTLKPAPAEREGNIKVYSDRTAPLDPRLVPAIVDFVSCPPR